MTIVHHAPDSSIITMQGKSLFMTFLIDGCLTGRPIFSLGLGTEDYYTPDSNKSVLPGRAVDSITHPRQRLRNHGHRSHATFSASNDIFTFTKTQLLYVL